MRIFAEILLIGAALPLFASFDSTAWMASRADRVREAERLRTAYAKCAAAVQEPAENVSVPVENYPDGSVKASVVAERAQIFLKDGLIWCAGVKIRQFRPDGSVESEIDAANCVVDRTTRSGWADGDAKATYRGEAYLSGAGIYFSAKDEYVMMTTNVCLKADGNLLRARSADYDRKAGIAMFEGGVEVEREEKGQNYRLTCDRAFAFIRGTNDVQKIVALGGVNVQSEDKSGACERAVYRKVGGAARITMFGGESNEFARLSVAGDRKGSVEGRRIRFWLDSEQVEVLDSRISVETNGLQLPRGLKQ